ncbi:MAG: Crp/Fnr family transcriptional regulator [Vicinamibacterales bacterium]
MGTILAEHSGKSSTYRPREVIFSQGETSASVMYLHEGTVKLSVVSGSGQEALVGILLPGSFFGENALLAGAPSRRETATAITAVSAMIIPTPLMTRLLRERGKLRDRFVAYTLARNIRLEADLLDQMFQSSEARLARALLLLANQDPAHKNSLVRLQLTQQALAEMVGTTRSRVNFFLNRFKKRGYIEYGHGGLKVNDSP